MTSFNAQPSLFQPVSILLLPLTFLIPPCLSLFSPSFFPSLPLSLQCTGRQAKLFSCVIRSSSDLPEDYLSTLNKWSDPCWHHNLLQKGWTVSMYIQYMWHELSKSLNLGGGSLKNSHHTPSAQWMCVCVFFYLTARKGLNGQTDCTT